MADYIFTQNGDGNVQIGDMTGMPHHVNIAFKWALEHNYQSVAAQYARTLALEVERLRDENAAFKADIEARRLVRLPDFPQDMNDLLEPLKVQSALNSEVMKLNFRKEHKPKDVSILDYTVIAALNKVLTEAARAALTQHDSAAKEG